MCEAKKCVVVCFPFRRFFVSRKILHAHRILGIAMVALEGHTRPKYLRQISWIYESRNLTSNFMSATSPDGPEGTPKT